MGYIGRIIFGIVQFAAILLISFGIPLGMMQPSEEKALNLKDSYCISMWGIKDSCLRLNYAYKPEAVWSNCSGREGRFKAARVCAIIAVIIFAVSFLLSFLMSCCYPCISYVCILLNFAAMVFVTVCWGCMLDCYLRNMGSDTTTFPGQDVCVKLKSFHGTDGTYVNGMHLGTGFILIVVGWALGLVNMFVLLLPC
ncbi:amastin-like protein [Leptomonas pyrrhocoris]|uniref:Amastin-like protein n=1 Tax=Leptomonas pyrrhocoris TaxID=157538 RepID=A0A0N0DWR9_LEPPY|nr:amastin-like protein [Leptomonas pyrrhocoris]KPA82145.1 amastin-like protein [Leptomonas pyrrhocoris]|eukprot:XP_015660584.1 amastin-like protein [Leptomonas pyrrhocoris]